MAATRCVSRASGRIPSLFCLTGNLSENSVPTKTRRQTLPNRPIEGKSHWAGGSLLMTFPVCSGISVTIQILLVCNPDSLSSSSEFGVA